MNEIKVKVLEFYSGIGGMHFALKSSRITYEVLGAFDINTNANAVYKHNFPDIKIYQKNLEGITTKELDNLAADCWTMSPPCQPYTRQGKQEASNDARAKSFLRLMNVLKEMNNIPKYLLLENVKGFELSDTREMLVDILKSRNYTFKEFLLTPTDFSIPNSRLRYYLVAKISNFSWSDLPIQENPIELKSFPIQLIELSQHKFCKKYIDDYLDNNKILNDFLVKPEILLRFYRIMDIVQSDSTGSCCFTKAYSKYIEGTGSLLTKLSKEDYTGIFSAIEATVSEDEKLKQLLQLQLQYFSPKEVSSLLMFPESFSFPTCTTLKQKYQLLGNSVNVFVIRFLMENILFLG